MGVFVVKREWVLRFRRWQLVLTLRKKAQSGSLFIFDGNFGAQ